MEFHLSSLLVALIFSIGVMATDASTSTLSPRMYWSKALPNTPMPAFIKDMLETTTNANGEKSQGIHKKHKDPKLTLDGCSPHLVAYEYQNAATDRQVEEYMQKVGQMFLLKKDMTVGSKVTMQWTPPGSSKADGVDRVSFLPRQVADSIPFSSEKLPEILTRLSIDPKSKAVEIMKGTIDDCEQKDASSGRERRACSTSLESMITFSTSVLESNDVKAMASVTAVDKDAGSVAMGKTEFTIVGVKKMADYGTPTIACHKHPYPYAVFLCHTTKDTSAYTVSLAGGGMRVSALAVCHGDTSWWNPMTMALQLLKARPGTSSPVCHFLEGGNLLWIKN